MIEAELHQQAGIPPGTVLDAKFQIVRCIGRGGMGAVYEVQHRLTQHRRALKLLHADVARDRDAVERFLKEASAAGRIADPHIIDTFDAGWLSSGEPYLLMELLSGETVDERLGREQTLPIKDVLTIIGQAAHALHAAHEAGIVHRDLKPENLFLTTTDKRELFVKILDFGVSKFDDGLSTNRATREGAFMGTPAYMSPEQFLDGKKVDGRTDVYALGVILFECATGQHPYTCDTFAELAHKIVVEETPAPTSVLKSLPPELDAIVARALAKKPSDRYVTARQLGQALDNLRTGSGLTLPQGSTWRSEFPPASFDETQLVSDGRAGRDMATQRSAVSDPPPAPAPAPPSERMPSARTLWLVLGLAVVAGVVGALALRSVIGPSPPASSAAAQASSSAAPVVSTEAPPPEPSADSAERSATTAAPPPEASPNRVAPTVSSVAPPTKAPGSATSDIAGVDEFP